MIINQIEIISREISPQSESDMRLAADHTMPIRSQYRRQSLPGKIQR